MVKKHKCCYYIRLGNDRGNNFGLAGELRLSGPGFIQWFILCLEYIAKQATCVLTPHVNAANGVA